MTEEAKDTVQATDVGAPEVTVQETATPEKKVKQDIVNMKQHLANLEQDDKDLYADEIKSLKEKIAASENKLQQEAKSVVADVKTVEKTFREKYGNEVLNSVEIVALVAIIWRLFFF